MEELKYSISHTKQNKINLEFEIIYSDLKNYDSLISIDDSLLAETIDFLEDLKTQRRNLKRKLLLNSDSSNDNLGQSGELEKQITSLNDMESQIYYILEN